MRLVFGLDDQVRFFNEIKRVSSFSNKRLGDLVGVSGRSFGDWVRGETFPEKKGVVKLSKRFGVAIPKVLEEREEYWSGRINGRKGALKRLEIYGPPGTLMGRKKGGMVSWQRRRENPDYYKKLGCVVENKFNKPSKSEALAEFIGIVLGDGCLTRNQCQIYLNVVDDKKYIRYVVELVSELFGYKPSVVEYVERTAAAIVISGVSFVKMMEDFGLVVGNKTKNQVDIPGWIKSNKNLFRACVRGLFDTDGGTFTHKHWIKEYYYCHFGMTFTSESKPLLFSFKRCLETDGIKSFGKNECLFVYKNSDIDRFFDIYQTRNEKHTSRFKDHLSRSTRLN